MQVRLRPVCEASRPSAPRAFLGHIRNNSTCLNSVSVKHESRTTHQTQCPTSTLDSTNAPQTRIDPPTSSPCPGNNVKVVVISPIPSVPDPTRLVFDLVGLEHPSDAKALLAPAYTSTPPPHHQLPSL
ncbi:hypothetical protein HMN09_01193800 [Mycena chlorophos]|uniref:Uncharacterized protein n=1 Tax=Mycena chlorophos TaxID=658473 RepID=A0A8H6S5I6_MYCCL|nr:hypothetical protein HMN09_01193800 [Mycena chlorophos]